MTTVATLAATLHTLFTATAQLLGRATGLIQRQRDLSAADFAQTLVFGWIDQPRAALESFALRLDLSAQALHRRLGPAAHAFFQALIAQALRHVQAARPTRLGLRRRLAAVVVEDSSIVALPADLAPSYRGHGGPDPHAGRAALKVLARWELLTGQLLSLRCVPAVTADPKLAAAADDLPAGALHLADQGFFDTRRWAGYRDRFRVSRVPAGIAVAAGDTWQPLAAFLAGLGEGPFDGAVRLVQSQGLACRLTARRCPAEVAARRRQKLREYTRSKKGRAPSARQLALCDWPVLATNVPAARLSAKALWVVYRCRWQVELLSQRGKQQSGWAFSHGRTGARVLTAVLAKVLGMIVGLWATLRHGARWGAAARRSSGRRRGGSRCACWTSCRQARRSRGCWGNCSRSWGGSRGNPAAINSQAHDSCCGTRNSPRKVDSYGGPDPPAPVRLELDPLVIDRVERLVHGDRELLQAGEILGRLFQEGAGLLVARLVLRARAGGRAGREESGRQQNAQTRVPAERVVSATLGGGGLSSGALPALLAAWGYAPPGARVTLGTVGLTDPFTSVFAPNGDGTRVGLPNNTGGQSFLCYSLVPSVSYSFGTWR